MRNHKITVKRCILTVAIFYLLYAGTTAIVPAMLRKSVSDEFISSVSVSDFYGEQTCVDRVALAESPSEGFDSRLHIIDEATERIDVSYYAMHMGETTDLFLGALLNAADRGVQVRIIVDAQSGGLTQSHSDYAAALGAHPNIELKVYNPINLLKPWTWNGRLHDKYIIVDDRLLLLGGRNIGDKYFEPEGYESGLSLDRDVLIYNTAWDGETEDSVLFRVREYMDELWDSAEVRQIFPEDTRNGTEKRQELQKDYDRFRAEHAALFDHAGDDYETWTYPANRISFIHNDTQASVKEPKVGYTLGQLLLSAEDSVTMQSPYIILDPLLQGLLEQLGEKSVDGRILTNSVSTSPNPIACTAYYGDRDDVLESGLELWEYQGEDSIHAKSYVIDDRMTVVGSYNLDPRSAYLNTELLLVIDSPEFTAHFEEIQDAYFRQSLQVTEQGEYQTDTGVEPRPVSVGKWIMIYGLYLPAKLFKSLA